LKKKLQQVIEETLESQVIEEAAIQQVIEEEQDEQEQEKQGQTAGIRQNRKLFKDIKSNTCIKMPMTRICKVINCDMSDVFIISTTQRMSKRWCDIKSLCAGYKKGKGRMMRQTRTEQLQDIAGGRVQA
jgi:hypothetical protein